MGSDRDGATPNIPPIIQSKLISPGKTVTINHVDFMVMVAALHMMVDDWMCARPYCPFATAAVLPDGTRIKAIPPQCKGEEMDQRPCRIIQKRLGYEARKRLLHPERSEKLDKVMMEIFLKRYGPAIL